MTLYHYTCEHGHQDILADAMLLRPGPDGLIWLTDMAVPDRYGLGLTMQILRCDRAAWRFETDDDTAQRWTRWAHSHRVPSFLRQGLDGAPGAMPLRWWVAESPVRACDVTPVSMLARLSPLVTP